MSNITLPCITHSSEWEKQCSSVREALVLGARGPFTFLCMVHWVSIWKECFLTVRIFKVEEQQICAKQALASEWRNSVAFLGKPLILEARWFSSMFSIQDWVSHLREYELPFFVSLGEEHHLCSWWEHTSEREKNCTFCKRILNVRKKRV